jgi:hypothetical protein
MLTTKSVCVQPVVELLFTLAYAHPRLPVVLFQLLLSPPMNSTWIGSGVLRDLACTDIAYVLPGVSRPAAFQMKPGTRPVLAPITPSPGPPLPATLSTALPPFEKMFPGTPPSNVSVKTGVPTMGSLI